MEHFDKFRRKLRDQQTDLPEDLQWDAMEPVLFKEQPSRKPVYRRYILAGLLLSLLGAIVIWQWSSSDTSNSQPTTSNNTKIQNEQPSDIIGNEIDLTSNTIDSFEEEETVKAIEKPPVGTSNESTKSTYNDRDTNLSSLGQNQNSSAKADDKNDWSSTNNKQLPKTDQAIDKTYTDSDSTSSTQGLNNDLFDDIIDEVTLTDEPKPSINSDELPTEVSVDKHTLTPITKLDGILKSVDKVLMDEDKIKPFQQLPVQSEALSRISFGLITSVGGWNPNFGDQYARYQHTTPSITRGLEADIRFDISPNLYTRLGIGVQQLYNRFEYTSTELSSRLVVDTVIYYTHNPITQESQAVRGDVNVVDTIINYTRQYNEYSLVNIPLSIGYTLPYNKWLFSVEAGGQLGILAGTNGKFLGNDGQITSYNNDRSQYTSTYFSAQLQLAAERPLTDHLSISIGIRSGLSMNNWLQTDQRLHPRFFQSNLGIRYRL